ncbi:MAG: flagellar biosynthetic protein FliQ [Oscillospiraceae bacterium]|nr:flagellar biosynthetic protein FliQ [Oscillospiraceae bacterium]
MSEGNITTIISMAIFEILWLSLPMLGLGLIVGLTISIIQATTQVNEQTIVFVAKILSVFIGLIIFGAWMLIRLRDFTFQIYEWIGNVARGVGI